MKTGGDGVRFRGKTGSHGWEGQTDAFDPKRTFGAPLSAGLIAVATLAKA